MNRKWFAFALAFCAVATLTAGVVSAQDSDSTTMVTRTTSGEWDIDAPVSLRATTPQEDGVWDIKNTFGWYRMDDRDDDNSARESETWSYTIEAEYGFAPGHHGSITVPWVIGEGRVDGNGDVHLGWHWRLREENDCDACGRCVPSFAMRNSIRIPTGYHSSGIDYTWMGMFSHWLTPGKSRVHLNGFVTWLDGDNLEDSNVDWDRGDWRRGSFFRNRRDAESMQYGGAVGIDYMVNNDMTLVWDYSWESELFEGGDNNTALELGLEWAFAANQSLNFAGEYGLDGDDEYGLRVMYQFDLQ